jgi:hypothetical protein
MNSDTATAKPAVLAALRKANAVIGIGDIHGWPRPQAYTAALSMLNSAREAERAVPTLPPAPDKPKDIKKWIDATVEVRHQETARRDIIDELVLTWERETAAAGLAATADYANRLTAVFDELVEKFDAHAEAPRQLTGHETPEEIEAHTAALRVASELSNALLQRAQIADAAGEGEDIGLDMIWLVLQPVATTTRDGINDALAAFKSRVPQTLTEWDELRPLGLRLAQIGEVATRRQRHSDFMHTIGMSTPDMGMRDHAYGEIEDNPPGPAYGLTRQAETDYMFANSPSMNL